VRLALLGLAFVSTVACAQVLGYDDYQERRSDAGASDTAIDTEVVVDDVAEVGPPPARPPARPSGEAKPSGTGKTLWLAFRRYELGSVDPAGIDDLMAWSVHGYDLDQICTTKADSVANLGTCRRPEGAQQDSLVDGERCRDNNFGRHVGTILRSAAPATEKNLVEQLGLGAATWLLRIDDVDAAADDPYAPATLYRVADERMSATKMMWDGTDVRAIHSDTVLGGDVDRGVFTLPRGYVAKGVWVSGEPSRLDLLVPVTATLFVPMRLQSAVITLDLASSTGVVAGAIAREDVEAVLMPIADNGGVCPGTALYTQMLSTVAKMPDVSLGAPNLQDTTRICDGVSAGMSFAVAPIQPVTKVVAPPPPRQPKCADAG